MSNRTDLPLVLGVVYNKNSTIDFNEVTLYANGIKADKSYLLNY